jgi:hypothetical protein
LDPRADRNSNSFSGLRKLAAPVSRCIQDSLLTDATYCSTYLELVNGVLESDTAATMKVALALLLLAALVAVNAYSR